MHTNTLGLNPTNPSPPSHDSLLVTFFCGHHTGARWEIDPQDIVLGKILGKGAFGEVFRAKLHGKEVHLTRAHTRIILLLSSVLWTPLS